MYFISGIDLYRRSQRNVKDILHSYLLATHYDPNWYKAWHTWALANFEVVNHLLNQAEAKAADVMGTTLVPHIIPAVQGNVVCGFMLH
jgi:FKBP12-rapamycin complex-associated protein